MIQNDRGIKYYHNVTPVVAGKMKIFIKYLAHACIACYKISGLFSKIHFVVMHS